MRESYGTLFDRFWDGPTGREIQARGKDAVIVATYLAANKHANMIGLYELPIVTIAHYLPVLHKSGGGRVRAIRQALDALRAVEYAYFDLATSFVWVREMARIRMQLEPGQALAADDNRVPAINKLYASLKPNPFLGPFFSRYVTDLRLTIRRSYDEEGPPQAPSDPLPSPSEASKQKQEQVQASESSSRDQEQGSGRENSAPRDARTDAQPADATAVAADPPLESAVFDGPVPQARDARSTEPKGDNFPVIAKLAREIIAAGTTPEGDLIEAVKVRAARERIDYGRLSGKPDVVNRAVASELYKAKHPDLVRG